MQTSGASWREGSIAYPHRNPPKLECSSVQPLQVLQFDFIAGGYNAVTSGYLFISECYDMAVGVFEGRNLGVGDVHYALPHPQC